MKPFEIFVQKEREKQANYRKRIALRDAKPPLKPRSYKTCQ